MSCGVYIHLPFCRSRCGYCDFYSTVADTVPKTYIDALTAAFTRLAPLVANGAAWHPETVYFGGGTPSLLSPAQVRRLLRTVAPAHGAEITLEANPESLSYPRLCAFRQAGVNRLSLGLQSAYDTSLRALGRPHTAAQAKEAMAMARRAGFTNISGDIMLALPGYSQKEFDASLLLLSEGGAVHISAYLLKLEPETPMGKKPPPALPAPDEAAEFYLYAAESLANAGYARYEISNFAMEGYKSLHNLNYWRGANWLGIGPAAHSLIGRRMFSFAPNLAAFMRGEDTLREEGYFTAQDALMLALRLEEGFSEEALAARWGLTVTAAQRALLDKLCENALARKTAAGYALTGEGMLVQNSILSRLQSC